MTNLFAVRIEFEFVLAASDTATAQAVARAYARDAFRDQSIEELDPLVTDYRPGILPGWDDDCAPYGGDDTTTIGEHRQNGD